MPSFRVYNKSLDPKLWNEDKTLDSEVHSNLLRVTKDYYDENEGIQGGLVDVYLVGSSANYNWTPDSDLDLHFVVDSEKIGHDEETAKTIFELMSHKWNQQHDIKIKGHKLEIYLQDVNHKLRSSGIYSLVNGEWVKEPHPEKVDIDKDDIKEKYRNASEKISQVVKEADVVKMKKVMEDIRNMRNTGLDKSGEFSVENLVFKMLRKFGDIGKLKDATYKVYDRELSVTEGLKNPNDLIIGFITPSLKIKAKVVGPEKGHEYAFPEVKDWYNVMSWRFRKDLNTLYWWTSYKDPTVDERDEVISFLEKKYNARNIKQVKMVIGQTFGTDTWDKAHGVDEITEDKNQSKYFKVNYNDERISDGKGATIYLNNEWFANTYQLPEDWGEYGGKWVFNRAGGALKMKFPSIEIGFKSADDLLNHLDGAYEEFLKSR